MEVGQLGRPFLTTNEKWGRSKIPISKKVKE